MEIQYEYTKNSLESNNYLKSKTLRELNKFDMTEWSIVIEPSVPYSGQKNTSKKIPVDSVQN